MKKTFSNVTKHSTQNNRWLAYSSKNTPRVMQTKFSQTVMVFGCVSCEGDVMPPKIFREGLRLISDADVELLITVVKSWITRVANGRSYVWQQDFAHCPLGKVKNGCRRIFATAPFLMFGLQAPQILAPWIIMYRALLRKTPITVPVLHKHS